MDLSEYLGKRIKATFKDGEVLEGSADFYESALDNPDGVDTLSLRDTGLPYALVDVTSDEVEEIEVLEG